VHADAEELKDTVIGDCCQADLAQVSRSTFYRQDGEIFLHAGWSKVHQLKQVGLGRVSENFFFTYRTLLESPWMLVCFAVTC
jgi:hypothetical protein